MARAHLRSHIRDRAGNAIVNALVNVYLTGTTTPVSDMYNAASGGALVTTLTSNSQGEIEAWLDAPRTVDLLVTDNSDAAYYSGDSASLVSFASFTETVDVAPPAAETAQLDEAQVFTAQQTFSVPPVLPSYAQASLPAAGTAGRLSRVSDTSRGVWMDTGSQWFALSGGVFNVKEFGAVGDGVTDDTAAIQAAIDAAEAASGIVFLAAATYRCNSGLTSDASNCGIVGCGKGASVIDYRGTGTALAVGAGTTNRTRVLLADFQIDGRNAGSGSILMQVDNVGRSHYRNLYLNGTSATVTALKVVGSATKSTYFNRFYDVDLVGNTAALNLGDACNANSWVGGIWEGTGYAVLAQPTTTTTDTCKFVDVAMQTSGATIVQLGGGGAAVSDCLFVGCRLEPATPANFTIASGSLRNTVLGGTFSNNVTWNPPSATAGNVLFLPALGRHQVDTNNASDALKTIWLRPDTAGITVGTTVGFATEIGPVGPASQPGVRLGADVNWYREAANIAATDDKIHVGGELELDGDLNHDGTNVGFFAVSPAARAGTTDDIKDALTSYGLLQGTSATPLDLDGGDLTCDEVQGKVRRTLGPWTQDNVAASQTAATLNLYGDTTRSTRLAIRAGSVTGIVVRSNEARTAGTLTVEVTKNGTGTGLTAVLDGTNTTFKATTQATGTDTYVAGDELGVTITTDGTWAPTTADIQCEIEVVE